MADRFVIEGFDGRTWYPVFVPTEDQNNSSFMIGKMIEINIRNLYSAYKLLRLTKTSYSILHTLDRS